MGLPRIGDEESMSFIQTFGRTFGTKRVTVTPGAEQPERAVADFEALVQTDSVDFNVDTPIYEGDLLEWDDPRGAKMRVYASGVEVFDAGSKNLRHISVKWAKNAPLLARPSGAGHTIVVNGSNVNIALEGSTISQQLPVQAEYGVLADAVGRALAYIEQTTGVDPVEVDAAREFATGIIEESAKPSPDVNVIKRLLPTLRGVLTSAANAGAGSAASQLVSQLFA